MESLINSSVFGKLVSIYGYSSKSVPGIEINGIGKYGKAIQEKIVYITRTRQLQIPLKRYVINVEFEDNKDVDSEMKWLELPLLIQYWQLAGILPMVSSKNILAVGSLSASGEVTLPDTDMLKRLADRYCLHLPTNGMFSAIPSFKVNDEEIKESPSLPAKYINPFSFKCRKEDYEMLSQHIANLRMMITHAERMASEVKNKNLLYDVEVSAFLETF